MENTVSIVLPTFNEEKNIKRTIENIWQAGIPLQYEVLVVDDGDDRTAEFAESVGARVVKGKRRGLGQAIIDGIEKSVGDIVVVMDADGQHPASAIPRLLRPILQEGADMTIGSRYVKGGKVPNWSLKRRLVSRVACLLALPVTSVRDATSGFFAFRKSILKGGSTT